MSNLANPEHKTLLPAAVSSPATSEKRTLLHCLRQQARQVRLYQINIEMIGMALTTGCIGTGEAMQLLVQLDGAACLSMSKRNPG